MIPPRHFWKRIFCGVRWQSADLTLKPMRIGGRSENRVFPQAGKRFASTSSEGVTTTRAVLRLGSDPSYLEMQKKLVAHRKAKPVLHPSRPFLLLYYRLRNLPKYHPSFVPKCWSSSSTVVEARRFCSMQVLGGGIEPGFWSNGSRGGGAIGATGALTRAFGGQSVVPWELALFLVEEMKGEGVEPGAVVFTAALAECRWAGEQRHVEYLRQEMDDRDLQIVPGIPGARDDDPPPSQVPHLCGKLPEPSSLDSEALKDESDGDHFSAASAGTRAAKTADTALATIEAMWAGGKYDPSSATCRAALDACAAGGKWERALSLIRDSTVVDAADADSGGNGPHQVSEDSSVPARVEAMALEGRWTEAFSLVNGGKRV